MTIVETSTQDSDLEQEQILLEQELAKRPDWARIQELKKLQLEHPDKVLTRIELVEVEHRRTTLLKPNFTWGIKARSVKELVIWDTWVRHELKRKLDIDEPSSYSEDDLTTARIREQNNRL